MVRCAISLGLEFMGLIEYVFKYGGCGPGGRPKCNVWGFVLAHLLLLTLTPPGRCPSLHLIEMDAAIIKDIWWCSVFQSLVTCVLGVVACAMKFALARACVRSKAWAACMRLPVRCRNRSCRASAEWSWLWGWCVAHLLGSPMSATSLRGEIFLRRMECKAL